MQGAVTYAQKSSTVAKVVMTFWLASQSLRLSFLKYHSAHTLCNGCLINSSGSMVSALCSSDSKLAPVGATAFIANQKSRNY